MEKNNSVMSVIKESFKNTPSPFEENGNATKQMINDNKYSETLEKSRRLMNLVESSNFKSKRNGNIPTNVNNDNESNFYSQKKSIMESFNDLPPISGDNFQNYLKNQNLVTEEKKYNGQEHTQAFDYSLLKMIVNECIKENLQQIKESLNENVIRGMRVNQGGIIQFLDKSGNLYEGQIKLKKKKS